MKLRITWFLSFLFKKIRFRFFFKSSAWSVTANLSHVVPLVNPRQHRILIFLSAAFFYLIKNKFLATRISFWILQELITSYKRDGCINNWRNYFRRGIRYYCVSFDYFEVMNWARDVKEKVYYYWNATFSSGRRIVLS